MPPRPHAFTRQDDLERRYDGPIPLAGPAVTGRARLFGRLAAETQCGAAQRRAVLTAKAAAADGRLDELVGTLAHYRRAGLNWRR